VKSALTNRPHKYCLTFVGISILERHIETIVNGVLLVREYIILILYVISFL
jgi:hypothetical protein